MIYIYSVLTFTTNIKRKKKYHKPTNVYEIKCGNELVSLKTK